MRVVSQNVFARFYGNAFRERLVRHVPRGRRACVYLEINGWAVIGLAREVNTNCELGVVGSDDRCTL